MLYETPEDWHARAAASGWRSSACRASARPASPRCCARRPSGSTTRSISASAPATWASTSSTTSSARRCATRSCASCCARTRSTSPPTSPSTTSSRSRPTSASPATRRRAASPSTSTCAASASTARPRSPPPATCGCFIGKAAEIYGYEHFVCDTSGSLCEVVDPDDPADPVMTDLAGATLPVWIRGTEEHLDELVRRFERAPKPMYYPEGFLTRLWSDYCASQGSRPRRSTPTPSSATASAP